MLPLITPVAFAQDGKPQLTIEEAQHRVRIWQTRVDDLTKEIVSESSSVSEGEQSLYLALLAKIWWKTDEVEARTHLKKAAQKMLGAMRTDEKAQLEKTLKYSQKTLEIISGLDEKFAQDLIGQLEAAARGSDDNKKKESQEMADLFASVGLQIVKSNPKLALAYGMDSLVYGFALDLPRLIVELHLNDAKLAESLVGRALVLARGSYTEAGYLLIFRLNRYMVEFNKGKAFSDALQRSVLEAFADILAGAASVEQERRKRCGIAYFAPAVLPRIDEYLPGLSLTFRQNLQACIPYTSPSTREKTMAASGDEPKTVDDILRAARDARDIELKVTYYRKAMNQLEEEKKFEEIIALLDGIDGDDYKKISTVGWDNWRIGATSKGALAAFEANDMGAVYRFIDKAPKRLRPYIRGSLVSKSSVAKNKEFFLENLDEMQKELNSLEFPVEDAARLFRELAHLYLTARPTESEAMFRSAVKYINKTDSENPDFLSDKDWAPMRDYVAMMSELIEIDEPSITISLNSISSRRSRVRLKLGLLESSLKKYVEAKKKVDELRKIKKAVPKPDPKQS
ncbi:MAG: hypothetical protein ABIV48_08605 [Pyrinomonadaceae bacterium]